ncbi:hypothetical protein Psta_0457 [Pirellula staleyi DSM 6068]|uniref:Uncharacterized protein n=1 Tax=Pirellula staleyi (strain ATCC 27377 / DSM 6068 / ICPB 4128) TaxID=530564 RepID=D2R3B4_PIRSD|nr:hypothetical protein Psta_0457 [Pirellula staleyi DSM 6068]
MKLQLYLVFVVDSQRSPHVGMLLATDSVHAMSRAIDRCKSQFGPTARVSRIQRIGEATLEGMQRTQGLQLLDQCDQLAFVAVELHKLSVQQAELLDSLTAHVQTLQSKLNGD